MKTAPRNVRVVMQCQAAQLADLPEELTLALADMPLWPGRGCSR